VSTVVEELLIGLGYRTDTKALDDARKKARAAAKDAEKAYEESGKAVQAAQAHVASVGKKAAADLKAAHKKTAEAIERAQEQVSAATTKEAKVAAQAVLRQTKKMAAAYPESAREAGDAAKPQARDALDAAKKTAGAAKVAYQAAEQAARDAASAAKDALDGQEKKANDIREKLVKGAKRVGVGLAAAGAAAAGGIALYTDHLVTSGRELDLWTEKTGASARELQRLEKAGERVNVPVDNMREGMKTLRENLGELARLGTGPARDALGSLGISLDEIKNLGAEDQIKLISDSLIEMTADLEPAEAKSKQLSLAIELMGEDGAAMMPLLSQGGDAIAGLGDAAEKAGQIMDDDMIATTRELDAAMKDASAVVEGTGLAIARELLPMVQDATQDFQSWLAENDELIKQDIPQVIGQIAEAFGFVADMVGKAISGIASFSRWLDDVGESAILDKIASLGGETRTVAQRGIGAQAAAGELETVAGNGAAAVEALAEAHRQRQDAAAVDNMAAALASLADQQTAENKGRATAAARRQKGRAFERGELAKAKGGGGGKSAKDREAEEALAEALVQVRTSGLEEDLQALGARAGATDTAIQSATEAAAKQFIAGASRQVAKKAGVGVLSTLTGVDLGKKQTDPLLSAIFGDDTLPDVPISELERGQTPQVLISTINNTYNVEVPIQVHGAGRDPASIADEIDDRFHQLFANEVAAVSKMSKVVFAR